MFFNEKRRITMLESKVLELIRRISTLEGYDRATRSNMKTLYNGQDSLKSEYNTRRDAILSLLDYLNLEIEVPSNLVRLRKRAK